MGGFSIHLEVENLMNNPWWRYYQLYFYSYVQHFGQRLPFFQALINKVALASNYLLFYWYQVFITTNKQKDTWKEFNHTAQFIHQRALCKFSAGKTLLKRHKQEPSESGRI